MPEAPTCFLRAQQMQVPTRGSCHLEPQPEFKPSSASDVRVALGPAYLSESLLPSAGGES